MKSKPHSLLLVTAIAGFVAIAAFSCLPAAAQAVKSKGPGIQVYVAHLHTMNEKTTGLQTAGEAKFTVDGNKLTISVEMHNAPPGIAHWQHLHGFKDGKEASCPTPASDANHDGVIDINETEPASGTTMVPLDEDPAGMQIAKGTYPKASADGGYQYREVISLKALDQAFSKAFDGQHLDLSHRVVMVHGVPSSKNLPASVASLGTIPAPVTLPIACGKIERVAH